jgi:hypothetical protein
LSGSDKQQRIRAGFAIIGLSSHERPGCQAFRTASVGFNQRPYSAAKAPHRDRSFPSVSPPTASSTTSLLPEMATIQPPPQDFELRQVWMSA